MAINLLEQVQQKLNYQPLHKIEIIEVDPNTEATVLVTDTKQFEQAAIPTVLVGLATFTRHNKNIEKLIAAVNKDTLMQQIFGTATNEVVTKVATYASVNEADTKLKMNDIADTAITIMQQTLPTAKTDNDIINFFEEQKPDILKYLPTEMHIGLTIENNVIDDATHKMDGPISGLMHALENTFSTTEIKTT